jgi:hypothetical protein
MFVNPGKIAGHSVEYVADESQEHKATLAATITISALGNAIDRADHADVTILCSTARPLVNANGPDQWASEPVQGRQL